MLTYNQKNAAIAVTLAALAAGGSRCSSSSTGPTPGGSPDGSTESGLGTDSGGGDGGGEPDSTVAVDSGPDVGPDVGPNLGDGAADAAPDAGMDASASDASASDASASDASDAGAGDPCADATAPTFTNIYNCTLAPNCVVCHGLMPPYGGSNLPMYGQSDTYAHLVDAAAAGASCGTSGLTRVVAGDPDASLLYHKVNDDTPLCGARMPLNGSRLGAGEIDRISTWIGQGAKNN